MSTRLERSRRSLPAVLGFVSLTSVGLLLAWDAWPQRFSPRAHDVLGALPLGLIGVAYLVHQAIRRPAPKELLKAILLAIAFFLWAANQLWPDLPQATLLNDLAIALFVLDVFLVVVGWPRSSPDEAFAETYVDSHRDPASSPSTIVDFQ